MNSHNAKPDHFVDCRSITGSVGDRKRRLAPSRVIQGDELSVADDNDLGSDPYNSTGQHIIVKAKKYAAE